MKYALLVMLLAAPLAHAQGADEAIPYSDDANQDEKNRRELPGKSDATPNAREETQVESDERLQSLAQLDDPSFGLSLEFLGGLMMLDSSKGAIFESKPMGGLRFTWEWSRTIFSDELFRELFFMDLTWSHAASSDGTIEVNATTNYHQLALAPAVSIPLGGPKTPAALYVQVGVGVAITPSALSINATAQPVPLGVKPLFQVGVGFRFRPLILTWGRRANVNTDFEGAVHGLRISFRVEGTFSRRSYMNDGFIGGSAGVTF